MFKKEVALTAVRDACAAEERKLTPMGFQLPHRYAERVASDDTVCVCQQSVQLHAGEMPAISAERTSTAANSRRRLLFLSGGVTCRLWL